MRCAAKHNIGVKFGQIENAMVIRELYNWVRRLRVAWLCALLSKNDVRVQQVSVYDACVYDT